MAPQGVGSEIARMCTSTDGNAFVRMAIPSVGIQTLEAESLAEKWPVHL